MIVRKQGEWMAAKVGEELVMMSATKDHYIGLTDVGARVWELLEAPQDIDGLCAQLQKEYAVTPDVCRTEVEAFVRELVKQGAATLDLDTNA